MTQDLRREVRQRLRFHQALRHDGPAVERSSVLLCRLASACIADDIASALSRHAGFRLRLPFFATKSEGRTLEVQAFLVDGLLVLDRVGRMLDASSMGVFVMLGGSHYGLGLEFTNGRKVARQSLFTWLFPSSDLESSKRTVSASDILFLLAVTMFG